MMKRKRWAQPAVPHPVAPLRYDAVGLSLLRFVQRWSDRLPEHIEENMRVVERYLMFALRDAVFVSRESRKLSTWRILDVVLISVDEAGTVTTVHPRVTPGQRSVSAPEVKS